MRFVVPVIISTPAYSGEEALTPILAIKNRLTDWWSDDYVTEPPPPPLRVRPHQAPHIKNRPYGFLAALAASTGQE